MNLARKSDIYSRSGAVKLFRWSIPILFAVWIGPVDQLSCQEIEKTTVFRLNDGQDSPYGYRIPALVTTRQGNLLAVCERRTGLHDHAMNDIVLRRSEDGGKTWGDLTVIAEAGDDSLNDPCAVVLDSGRILLRFKRYPEGVHQRASKHTVLAKSGYGGPKNVTIFLTHSDDDGKTWSPPRDVSRQMKRPTALAVGSPGIGIQLTRGPHRGRVLFPNYESFADGKGGRTFDNSVCFSDDGGATWQRSQRIGMGDLAGQGNEAQLVELRDGGLLLSTRVAGGRQPRRRFAFSSDGGETWSGQRLADELVTPPCMSSILRFDWPVDGKPGLLFHSLPNSPTRRNFGAIFCSRDEGNTWQKQIEITDQGFGYSCLTRLENGNLGCLYETGGYRSIVFAEIPLPSAADSQAPNRIRTLDLNGQAQRQVVVDREANQYLGHPTTCLLEDGRTILCVYPKGHGRGGIVYKRSRDGGVTWSGRLTTPPNWESSREVPTLHRVVGPDGKKRVIMWSGLYPARLAVSEDDGATWSPLQPVGDWGGIVVMGFVEKLQTGDGHYLAMFHDDGRFFSKNGRRDSNFKLYKTYSRDGGLTWSVPEVVFQSSQVHLCEPGCIRSPDGKQLAVLLRENSRRQNSHIIFSRDEGTTWSAPRELPLTLTGDRHTGKYGKDGRLFISFRCISPKSKRAGRPFEGDWVGWVGTWEDLVNNREGQYFVRLKDNTKAYDTAYPGVERLPDGTFVITTYGHWERDQSPYILCVRFKLDELDAMAIEAGKRPSP